MPTLLWDVRSALVGIFGEALGSTLVYDGPRPRSTSPPKLFVLVGSDGGDNGMGDGGEDGATVEQEPSTLGPGMWRDERGEVICSAWAWTGGTDFVPLRATISVAFDKIETRLRADRSLGGLLKPPGLAEIGAVRFREVQDETGAVARAAFTVSYAALLTT